MGYFTLIAKRVVNKLYSKPYLVFTNTISGVISISIGDYLQQNLEHHWENSKQLDTVKDAKKTMDESFVWNTKRTRNMMAAGVYFSLFGHFWYSWLDKKFPPNVKNSVRNKLIAECITGPLLVSSVFLLFAKINGQAMDTVWENVRTNFKLICLTEWLVFIPIQWINFTFIPTSFRYLYVTTISIGYDAFLSYVFHRNERYKHQWKRMESLENS